MELHSVTYKRIFFGHCYVTFPYMRSLSFFGRFVQKVIASCFSESIVQKTTQQSDAGCNVPSFCTNYSIYSKISLFISANIYEKYIVSKEYCTARHDDKMCFLPNCRYHIILIGNIKELLQKLDAFFFNYQHGLLVYTLQVPLQWQNSSQEWTTLW